MRVKAFIIPVQDLIRYNLVTNSCESFSTEFFIHFITYIKAFWINYSI